MGLVMLPKNHLARGEKVTRGTATLEHLRAPVVRPDMGPGTWDLNRLAKVVLYIKNSEKILANRKKCGQEFG